MADEDHPLIPMQNIFFVWKISVETTRLGAVAISLAHWGGRVCWWLVVVDFHLTSSVTLELASNLNLRNLGRISFSVSLSRQILGSSVRITSRARALVVFDLLFLPTGNLRLNFRGP